MSDRITMTVIADWQVFGDISADAHLRRMLEPFTGPQIKPAGTEPHDMWLRDFSIVHTSKGGPFGLQYILFTVNMEMTTEELQDAKDIATKRLNSMVGDTDVDVRWVERDSA